MSHFHGKPGSFSGVKEAQAGTLLKEQTKEEKKHADTKSLYKT